MFDVKVPAPAPRKGLHEMTADTADIADIADRDDEDIADVDELLVEEVSIDGMCGVY